MIPQSPENTGSCSMYSSLIVVLCMVFHLQHYIQPKAQRDLNADFLCFLPFSFLLLSLWCSVPQNPATSASPNYYLSLLIKTCSTLLGVHPCIKCDDRAYLICLSSFTDHSHTVPVIQCLIIVVTIFSPLFWFCVTGGYSGLVILLQINSTGSLWFDFHIC